MRKNELKKFLVDTYKCNKSSLITIADMRIEAAKHGLFIDKDIGSQYYIREEGIVKDFKKPLVMCKEMEREADGMWKGLVPLEVFRDLWVPVLWFYFMDLVSWQYIIFEDIRNWLRKYGRLGEDRLRDLDIAVYLDQMLCAGYLVELDKCIEFHAKPVYTKLKFHGYDRLADVVIC